MEMLEPRLAHSTEPARSQEAEQLYRQVLAAQPTNPNAWCYLGMALHDQERYDEAVAAYRRALELQPNFPIALNNLGNSLSPACGGSTKPSSCFDQAIALKPDYLIAYQEQGDDALLGGARRGGAEDL